VVKPNRKPRSPSTEELQVGLAKFNRKCELAEKIVPPALITFGVVAALYVGIYLPVQASHGETTALSVVYNLVGNFRVSIVISWAASLTLGIGWWRERKLRIRDRNVKDTRLKELEMHVDPNRTSSGLSPSGTTIRRVD
jgi:hypothetical protein